MVPSSTPPLIPILILLLFLALLLIFPSTSISAPTFPIASLYSLLQCGRTFRSYSGGAAALRRLRRDIRPERSWQGGTPGISSGARPPRRWRMSSRWERMGLRQSMVGWVGDFDKVAAVVVVMVGQIGIGGFSVGDLDVSDGKLHMSKI